MGKRHTLEFKKETVQLIIQTGRKVGNVARELGLSYWTIRGWMKLYGRQEQADLVSKGLKMTPEEENMLLKKELADIAEERDILKKAIAVFSKKPKLNTLS